MYDVIETTQDLVTFVKKIADHDWLALDTEFLREKTYQARLCLIQIESGGHRACIDPLQIDDLTPLTDLMGNPAVTKVLHSAHQDLEIFHQLMGEVPAPVFDTQIAAAVLGLGEHMGYARLVESMLDVTLAKTQTRTDWSKRPLRPAQLEYAIDDVRYLAMIYPMMMEQLESKQRLDWLAKDFARLASPQTYAIKARERWKKVRGLQVLKRRQLAVLRELAAWREEVAVQADRPRKWILSDEILLDLSRMQPQTREQFLAIRGLSEDRVDKHLAIWAELIKKGKTVSEDDLPELPRAKKPSATQNRVIDLLMIALQIEADRQGISPAAIASRKEIARMIQAGDTRLSEDWRGEIVNPTFQALLSGDAAIQVVNGQVTLKSIEAAA